MVSISTSYAFTENIAIRTSIFFSFDKTEKEQEDLMGEEEFSLNLGVPIYFSKMYTGFFIEPGVHIYPNQAIYTAVGYHWIWDSGFNTFIGLGLSKAGGLGYFQIGYAFL